MDTLTRKQALKQELIEHVASVLELARRAYAAAIEGATHAESRAENDKDTRGLEQSYLARGQAQRVVELEAELADLQAMAVPTFGPGGPIGGGALVTVDEDGDARCFFVAPHGGGATLAGAVQVVTPRSPLGRALTGRRVSDEVELKLAGKTRELVITAVE